MYPNQLIHDSLINIAVSAIRCMGVPVTKARQAKIRETFGSEAQAVLDQVQDLIPDPEPDEDDERIL